MMHGFSRAIVPTEDGSHTVAIPDLGITYHSTRGAVQESKHVFIEAGLSYALQVFPQEELCVFEMGFGTGLNALLTAIEARQQHRRIHYTAIEQHPVNADEIALLNHASVLHQEEFFQAMHGSNWNEPVSITADFTLHKISGALQAVMLTGPYHVIYYDAFAPDAQPELWTEAIFKKLYDGLAEGGVLTTYCSKSMVRRAMQAAGFTVKKIPGPPGKREMVQAFKDLSAEGK